MLVVCSHEILLARLREGQGQPVLSWTQAGLVLQAVVAAVEEVMAARPGESWVFDADLVFWEGQGRPRRLLADGVAWTGDGPPSLDQVRLAERLERVIRQTAAQGPSWPS